MSTAVNVRTLGVLPWQVAVDTPFRMLRMLESTLGIGTLPRQTGVYVPRRLSHGAAATPRAGPCCVAGELSPRATAHRRFHLCADDLRVRLHRVRRRFARRADPRLGMLPE
jgi:hypothetical protein